MGIVDSEISAINGMNSRTKPGLGKEGENCLGTKGIVAIFLRCPLLVILHLLGHTRREDVQDRE
jgi:hypothetical protein